MISKKIILPGTLENSQKSPVENEFDQTNQNLEAVLDFYNREEKKISTSQRLIEHISNLIGQPIFIGIALLFVAAWLFTSIYLHKLHILEFDPAPFHYLQGLVGLGALLISTIVLIKQNRLGKLEERRSHLDLKVMLLTEHKAAKLIQLIEELRRDLPNVKNRNDEEATILKQAISPEVVIATLDV